MSEAKPAAPESVILDLGRQKAKKVKKLRRGGGKLYRDVQDAVAELKRAGRVAEDAQTVIVVVEKESQGLGFPPMMPLPFGSDD